MTLNAPTSLRPRRPAPSDQDSIVVLRNAGWADFQRALEMRGDRSVPRIAYLEGSLELGSPSRSHELIKSMIGRLVEAWCFERGVDLTPYGSWTLEDKEALRGLEPDECYVIGDDRDPKRPHLAIEVVWTSGGIDKLEIYRALKVGEVWFWVNDEIRMFTLREGRYEPLEASTVLPGIDLVHFLGFLDVTPMTRAVRDYRASLRT